MAKIPLNLNESFNYLRSMLRKIHRRHPEKVARLIDVQFCTADRISSAYDRLLQAKRENRELTGFETALVKDAVGRLQNLELKKLHLPFWWKYGTWVVTAAIVAVGALGFAGYHWFQNSRNLSTADNDSHLSTQVKSLEGVAQKLGNAAADAQQPNFKEVGSQLINASNYLDMLAHNLGSQKLLAVSATIKKAGQDLQAGDTAGGAKDLAQAGSDMQGLDAGGIDFTEAGAAFTEAARLLAANGQTSDPAALKNLGIGLANDLLEAREVIMNAASKLEFYEEQNTLQNLENSLASADKNQLLQNMDQLGEVLKDLNNHLVEQSIPLMERNIPWNDLANLEKMTSGWDDTWPSYVPSGQVPKDLTRSPNAADPSLSPDDAKALFKALTEASQAIAQTSKDMELVRVNNNAEDLANIAKDLQAAEMALKETTKLSRAIAANYITSIKLNVPTSFEDVTMPTATCIGPAWIYQQQESNLGISDLWKMRYVSSYYGSLGIAGDQLGSAGEVLGSAFNMWTNKNDIQAIQDLKLGEEQLIGASKRMAMTLDNYGELQDLQKHLTSVQSYSDVVNKMSQQQTALEKVSNLSDALKAAGAEMQDLAQPFSVTPMYKPDAYYFMDKAGRMLGLAATQNAAQQQATIKAAADSINQAAGVMFGSQEINLREYGQFLEDIATNLTSTTANTGGQYFLGPIRKVTLDFRGLQELLGVQAKWEGQSIQQTAANLDRTLVAGTVLLRPVTGNEKSDSPNLTVSYYVEAANSAKWPQVKYSGELLAVPSMDPAVLKPPSADDAAALSQEKVPSGGADIMARYFLALSQNGTSIKDWIKKEVPVKPGQAHVTVPPLPPDMPPRQPPSSGGGLTCPAITNK